jgi:hypothetical protein
MIRDPQLDSKDGHEAQSAMTVQFPEPRRPRDDVRPGSRWPRSRRLLVLGCLAIGLCAISASSASAALPEFNLLGRNGGTSITQMDMSSGEFSGTAEIEGEHFSVTGTESGNKSESVLVLQGGSPYESFDTDYYEILADGNIGGEGSFHDTNGTEESYHDELEEPYATVASTTSVVCANTDNTYTSYTCTATVKGASGTPSGNVTFTPSSGEFAGANQCVLSGGSCSVTYTPTGGLASQITIKAVYSADPTFKVSQAATTICGSGGVSVTSVTPESSAPYGIQVDTKVKLAGKGLCPGMTVQFGNEQAIVLVEPKAIAADGTSATVTVPVLATTGTVTVSSARQRATLADPLGIDSFRNTEGFQFNNFGRTPSYAELASVLGSSAAYKTTTVNTCPPGNCPTQQLEPEPLLQKAFEKIYKVDEEKGLCFGFALSSLQFRAGAEPLSNFSESAQDAFQLGTQSSPGPTLEAFLATRFLMQYTDQARADRYAQATDPSRTGADLRSEIEAAGPGGVLVNLSGQASNTMVGGVGTTYQGHTMVATGVETAPGLVSTYFINVIDSNSPYMPGTYAEESTEGGVHAARVSHIVVGSTGQWSYESGPAERLSGTIDEITTTPLSVFKGPLTIGGKGGGPNLVSASASPEVGLVSLENADGQPLAVNGPTSGVVADPAATAASTSSASASFIAPLATYTDTLAGNGKPIGETWIASGLLAAATGTAAKASVSFDPTRSQIGFSPIGHSKAGPTTLTLVSSPPHGIARTATIESSASTAAVTAALNPGRTGVTVTSSAPTKIRITLNQAGGTDALVNQNVPALTLHAGETVSVQPATWRGHSGEAITVTIKPRHGRGRTLQLRAHSHIPQSPARIVHITQHRVHGRVSIAMQLDTPALPGGSTEAVTALVSRHGAEPRNYRVLASQQASTGERTLHLTIDPGGRRASVKIVLDTVLASTGQLGVRTIRLTSLR